ncbi:MAG TPA: DUF1330 domain-containing protein [Chryseolinea sp.]|nr:DUF1330 domain-containing protein [Chryseolinea sp.]HPM32720.1 DUF1330 domain-containing protein [Chryseolinea sp.]
MPAYVIVDVTVLNKDEYEGYKKLTPPSIAAYGGKFIVRGGATESLEGDWNPERIVILEFENMQLAKEWWRSELYAPAKEIRQRNAKTKMILVEGINF